MLIFLLIAIFFICLQFRSGDERINVGSLTGYKYVFEENALDNGRLNTENKCFCRHGKLQNYLTLIIFAF